MRIIEFSMDGDTLKLATMSWKQVEEFLTKQIELRDAEKNGNKVDWAKHQLDTLTELSKRANEQTDITPEKLREEHDLRFLNEAYKKICAESGIEIKTVPAGEAPALAATGA